jgi:hypothetical protein
MLTSRWEQLRYHKEQQRLIDLTIRSETPLRFPVVPAGRRSGKTEIAKRKLVISAMKGTKFHVPHFFAGAPTRDQAKRIWWEDLKLMTPPEVQVKRPSESELTIYYKNGSQLVVVGLDKPERIEGTPWDGGVLDEYGNMKADVWGQHIRPSLADRLGWCWFIGVPEGRNHYYDIDKKAKADTTGQWGSFHWISEDILPPEEIAAAKNDLDDLTYQQEMCASFISFQGRCYYAFNERYNTARIRYNPKAPLVICFDFNVQPGTASIIQEKTRFDEAGIPIIGDTITCIIGEVRIERNSNTPMVCNKIINDWGDHQGHLYLYGDASGGASGSAKVSGSDWDIISKVINAHFGSDRVHYRIPQQNPYERERINAVNSRCKSMEGIVRLLVDPSKAPWVIRDFEGVQVIPGGSGEIDKKKDPMLSHLTDGIGYYISQEFPVTGIRGRVTRLKGV